VQRYFSMKTHARTHRAISDPLLLATRCQSSWSLSQAARCVRYYYNSPSFSLGKGLPRRAEASLKETTLSTLLPEKSDSRVSLRLLIFFLPLFRSRERLDDSSGCRGDYERLIAEKRRDSPPLSSVSGIRERKQRTVLSLTLCARRAIVVARQLSPTSLSFKASSQVLRAMSPGGGGRFLEFSD